MAAPIAFRVPNADGPNSSSNEIPLCVRVMYVSQHKEGNFSIELALRPLNAIIFLGNYGPDLQGARWGRDGEIGAALSRRGPRAAPILHPSFASLHKINHLSARSQVVREFAAQISNGNRKSAKLNNHLPLSFSSHRDQKRFIYRASSITSKRGIA